MYSSKNDFTHVLANTPLVSIDLIVQNGQGDVLLGERKNRPAQGYWFMLGGRILKNEILAAAFKRLTLGELGTQFSIDAATLQGPYDHFYSDSVFCETPSSHYVAIANRLPVITLSALPEEQHSGYRWFSVDELLSHPQVHSHTKAYFQSV